MAFIQELFTSRNNKADPATYTGQRDRLWFDSVSNTIKIGDGTAGGSYVANYYTDADVAAYLPSDPTLLAVNASIITANLNMKAYVDAQVVSSGGYNDAAVAAYLPTYTGSLANSTDIIALYANAALQHTELIAANSAIVTANLAMKAYVDAKLGGGSNYGNTDVAAYLPTYTGSISNSTDIINLRAIKANLASPTFTGNVVISSNTAITMPVGTNSERPIGTAGQLRYNAELKYFEGYTDQWQEISSNVQLSANLQGGSNNQILVKKSSSDYDYAWEDMIINLPSTTYTKLLDQASTTVLYFGEAVPNSTESSAVWRIQKILFDASGNVEEVRYAAGGLFDQIWNNRTSLVYA